MQSQRPHLSSSKEVDKSQGHWKIKRPEGGSSLVLLGEGRKTGRSGQGHWVLRRGRRPAERCSSCPGERKQEGLNHEAGERSQLMLCRISSLAPQIGDQ